MSREPAAGTPLVHRRYSFGTPLLAGKKRDFEASLPGTPPPLRRRSAGTPPLVVRKSERTTYPLDRYDFKTNTPPTHIYLLIRSCHHRLKWLEFFEALAALRLAFAGSPFLPDFVAPLP